MPITKPIQISKYFSKSETSHNSVWSQVENLTQLNRDLEELLPQPLNKNCGIASIKSSQLTLYAESSAWCYKLRLHSSLIVKFLKKKEIFINQVKVIVLPQSTNSPSRSLPKPKITPEIKQILLAAKEALDDERIQQSLDKLIGK